jgi:hypothetical protein
VSAPNVEIIATLATILAGDIPRIEEPKMLFAASANGAFDLASVAEGMTPMIATVARDTGSGVIDLHATLVGHEALLPDNVHPNAAGAELMARMVAHALTGKNATAAAHPNAAARASPQPNITRRREAHGGTSRRLQR